MKIWNKSITSHFKHVTALSLCTTSQSSAYYRQFAFICHCAQGEYVLAFGKETQRVL